MLSPDDIEGHLDALQRIGDRAAEARADYEFSSDMLRTVYAAEYLKSELPRAADKEAEALASEAYRKALEDRRNAFVVAEKLRHERAWRERVIDAWQTMSANARGRIL
jgi:hypothetical protein